MFLKNVFLLHLYSSSGLVIYDLDSTAFFQAFIKAIPFFPDDCETLTPGELATARARLAGFIEAVPDQDKVLRAVYCYFYLSFADPKFVLINGSHWHSNANRRYIQCHAWIAEFEDIILEFGFFHNPNAQLIEKRKPPIPLLGNGPFEIIKYAENNLIMISLDLTIQQKALRELAAIRKLRIQITHKRIDINMISMIKYLTK